MLENEYIHILFEINIFFQEFIQNVHIHKHTSDVFICG